MVTFGGLFIGFLFGLGAGRQEMQERVQRRLREFFAAKRLRTVDASGSEIPVEVLIDAMRKDLPADQRAPA